MIRNTLFLNGEKFLTLDDVTKLFNVSRVTVWKWVKKGTIRQHHIGKFTYFLENELSEDIKNSGSAVRKSNKEKVQ